MERSKFTTKSNPILKETRLSEQLSRSISEHHIFSVYTCLVNQINPGESGTDKHTKFDNTIAMDAEEIDEDQSLPLEIERSKATHKIAVINNRHQDEESSFHTPQEVVENTEDNTDPSQILSDRVGILTLTRTKWLTEGDGTSDRESASSLTVSNSSLNSDFSKESIETDNRKSEMCDKHLSTIINIDKEHNLFGLADTSITSDITWKRSRKNNKGPAFPQSAIVLVCCGTGGCCRHRSKSDLPLSLKCGGCGYCGSCASLPFCGSCTGPLRPSPCKPYPTDCTISCPSRCCFPDCATCYGFKIILNKKPAFKPSPIEMEPRGASVLQKPAAGRICTHTPHCMPPSSCFPYMMPCYWPALSSSPCSNPSRCFHNPPCPPPRRRKCEDAATCPPESCELAKCPNIACIAKYVEDPNAKADDAKKQDSKKPELKKQTSNTSTIKK